MNEQKNNQETTLNPVSPHHPNYIPPQGDEISLLDLWRTLAEQKKLLFLITAISMALAITYAFLATPIYRAEALLAPVSKEQGSGFSALAGQFGGLASLAGINFGSGGSNVEEGIAILKSRDFINKFIIDENLMPLLFDAEWDKYKKQWINIEQPPTLWNAYKLFKSILVISQDKKTGLITLSIDWKDPVLAADWVDKLVARINNKLRDKAILDSDKSIQYLEAELQKTSVIEIKESIYGLIEAQTKTKMLASTQDEYAFRVLDHAVVPEEKFKPKRFLIVVLGFIVGLMIGVFSALIRSASLIKIKS